MPVYLDSRGNSQPCYKQHVSWSGSPVDYFSLCCDQLPDRDNWRRIFSGSRFQRFGPQSLGPKWSESHDGRMYGRGCSLCLTGGEQVGARARSSPKDIATIMHFFQLRLPVPFTTSLQWPHLWAHQGMNSFIRLSPHGLSPEHRHTDMCFTNPSVFLIQPNWPSRRTIPFLCYLALYPRKKWACLWSV